MKSAAFILAAALVAGALTSAAAVADDVQARLQSAYDGQCKAAIAKDASGFQSFFDPSYAAIGLDGQRQDRATVVAEVTTPQEGLTFATCSFTIRNVSVAGAVATATVLQTVTGTLAQGGGPAQPFTQVQESTDTWNVSGAPQQVTSTETGHRLTSGGKVVEEKGTMTAPPGRI